jgi:CubicO group peptidase (beta-lactamase class C family)
MSVYYVSNENGDWWTIDTESTAGRGGAGQTLFIIKAEDLAVAVASEYPQEEEIDINSIDKLDRLIREHGTAQDVEVA